MSSLPYLYYLPYLSYLKLHVKKDPVFIAEDLINYESYASKLKNKSGIYAFINKVNNNQYIGSVRASAASRGHARLVRSYVPRPRGAAGGPLKIYIKDLKNILKAKSLIRLYN